MKYKILTFIEGTFVVGLLLSMSAMDSPDMTIPAVVFIGSALGLLIASKIEENSTPADQSL